MGEGKTDSPAFPLAGFIHRAAQPLACARLAADTAMLRLEAGDAAGAAAGLRRVEEFLDALDAVLNEARQAAARP